MADTIPGSLFPRSGVPFTQAAPGATPNVDSTCDPRWYASRCNPRFDPAAANAVISELLGVITSDNTPYDCTRVDNLIQAIRRISAPLLSMQVYVTPGLFQYIIPPGVSLVQIEMWGGGGGGGGMIANQVYPSMGGGGGEYALGIFNVNGGDILDITVGAGGQRTIVGTQNATNGGQSKVEVVGGGTLMTANGGIAGANGGAANPINSGWGGSGGIGGAFRVSGGDRGSIFLSYGGTYASTLGGSASRGGFGGSPSTSNAGPGKAPGGGGGGGGSANHGAAIGGAGNGGDGAPGAVLLSF